jgi:DNA invertase Pin-like site-specific DNA recombinase
VKRAAIYARVSTADQHPETQLLDLRQMANNGATKSPENLVT